MIDWKYLQVRFEPELYKRLSVVAAERGESISEMVRDWAKSLYGEKAVKVVKDSGDMGDPLPKPIVKSSKPSMDRNTCNHKFVSYMGRGCVNCGWEPPIV